MVRAESGSKGLKSAARVRLVQEVGPDVPPYGRDGGQVRRSFSGARREREAGASLVEFALVAPLLFALLLGTFTGGMALARKNSVTNATREGARVGATVPQGADWATSVRDRVRENSSGDLTNNQICVKLVNSSNTVPSTPSVAANQWLGSDCGTEPALPSGVGGTTQCVVKVWSHRTSEFQTIFFTRTLSLDASAVARFERGTGTTCAAS